MTKMFITHTSATGFRTLPLIIGDCLPFVIEFIPKSIIFAKNKNT